MSRSNGEEEDQLQLDRRKFLKIGGLGAAALAAGAAGRAKEPETATPSRFTVVNPLSVKARV